jgi:subtilase family serine protease
MAQIGIPDRIVTAVADSNHIAIPDSVQPRARLATDLGPLAAETPLVGMSLRFLPSAAQQAALDQLLVDLQDPSSPRFHQWITPQQYAAQFGLSSADIAKVTAWLTSQGFTVTGVAQGGTFVTFDGTVAQAQAAFSTSIHSLSVNGESHFANVTGLSLPTAFAAVVGTVTGLHDFHPRPHLHASVVQPNFTSSVSGNHYLAPGDVATIYDVSPLLANSITGTGETIAVVGQVDISLADVAAFRSASNLTANPPITVHEGGDPGVAHNCTPGGGTSCPTPNLLDLGESSLDVEWSGAMAPSASVLFVNGPDVFANAMTQAIDLNLAPIISVSYGDCEAAQGSSVLNSYNQLFKQANAQGQTILAATGDTGATDCDAKLETAATEGLAVDFPASSPYITGMGGTQFNGDLAAIGSGSTWSTTQYWNGTSGSDVISSARIYIPEAAWNETTSTSGLAGGGGGASSFNAKPAWQVEAGASGMTSLVLPDGARDVPDLALNAAVGHDAYLICYNGSCVVGFRASAGGGLTVVGGTSCVAPVFAGMLALLEQKNSIAKAGNINPLLYALGNNVTYYNPTTTSVFHDVTSGSNAQPCAAGTVECPASSLTLGYNAGTGYDLATGWGSVDLNNLALAWSWAVAHPEGLGALGPNISATALTASSSTVAAAATDTLTATVTGSATTPTGTVQFLVNNVAVGSPVTLVSGVATYPWSPVCTALGKQSITAVYSGDTNYQGSIGPPLTVSGSSQNSSGAFITNPLLITVTSGSCPSFTLGNSAPLVSNVSTISVAAGGTIPAVTITATSQNGVAGTVTFSSSVAVIAGDSAGITPGLSLSPASVTLTASGAGSTATTTLTLSGIIASMHMPNLPGTASSATMLARQGSHRTPPWTVTGSGAILAALLLLVLPRRRRLTGLLLMALSVALAAGVTGCGGSSQPAPPATNPYAGTYMVTVTGAYTGSSSGILPQSTTVTYIIQ